MAKVRANPVRAVVGIGASAGGLQALKAFFGRMPAGCGLSFVVIQHLDPHAESVMPKILQAHSEYTVVEATDGTRLDPDMAYMLPPGKMVRIEAGRLVLRERDTGRGGNFPVDVFLSSLAADRADEAIAVILTGSGADGSQGVLAIKAQGGAVLVQDPASAEQASMPESAIATGVVDVVARVEDIPERLVDYAMAAVVGEPLPGVAEALPNILALVQTRAGVDLTGYKTGTLARRIQRRMGLRGVRDAAGYLALLRRDREESDQLARDVLIGVTSFFREPEAFEQLATRVIPGILAECQPGEEVRVWVAGCSTGEEAYSLGMLFLEAREAAGSRVPIRIFASDVSEEAIDTARAAVYAEDDLSDIDAARRTRWFEPTAPGRHRVVSELREIVTFALHDLLSDPPFPKLDLISCRNVLIYLQPEVQRNLMVRFHFSLKPGGCLFLGRTEQVPEDAPFEVLSRRARIYRAATLDGREHAHLGVARIKPKTALTREHRAHPTRGRAPAATEVAAEWLLERHAPAAVVIDRRHEVLGFHGPVDRYLNLPRGEAVFDLLAMPRESIRAALRTAVYRGLREGKAVRVSASFDDDAGAAQHLDITVEPIATPAGGGPLFMVTFEPLAQSERSPTAEPSAAHDDVYVMQLEDELKATRADLDETVESSQAHYEELQAANEEVTSMNEELRAANEELMSSKEELQALNEEVSNRNDELGLRLDDLQKVTDDLNNLLAATGIATVFLDRDCRIVRATPSPSGSLNVRPTDAGRPLREIAWPFEDPDVLTDARHVLKDLTPRQKEVRGEDGRRFLRRVLPYRGRGDRIEGVFITVTDIEAARSAEDAERFSRDYAEAIVETVHEPLIVLTGDCRVASANRAFYDRFRIDPREANDRSFFELGSGRWNVPELRRLLEEMLPRERQIRDFQLVQDLDGTGPRTFVLNARRLEIRGVVDRILLAIEERHEVAGE